MAEQTGDRRKEREMDRGSVVLRNLQSPQNCVLSGQLGAGHTPSRASLVRMWSRTGSDSCPYPVDACSFHPLPACKPAP